MSATGHFTSYSHLKLCHANVIIVIKVLEKSARQKPVCTTARSRVTYKCIKQRGRRRRVLTFRRTNSTTSRKHNQFNCKIHRGRFLAAARRRFAGYYEIPSLFAQLFDTKKSVQKLNNTFCTSTGRSATSDLHFAPRKPKKLPHSECLSPFVVRIIDTPSQCQCCLNLTPNLKL